MKRHSFVSRLSFLLALALVGLACNAVSSGAVPAPAGVTYTYDNLPDESEMTNTMAEFQAISKWGKFDLTYVFLNGTDDLPGDEERELVRQAFALWTAETPLTFTEVAGLSQADIEIAWYSGDHGDGDPFDGPGDVLAHASFPNPFADRLVVLHFDLDERWVNSTAQDVDLVTVAAHEIGHVLGLDHSDDPDALMYPSYFGPRRFLGDDDIAGVQSLYGPRETPVEPPAEPPSDATPPPADQPDSDGDGLSDEEEAFFVGTNPANPDTDGDGLSDGLEVLYRMNPLDPDMDRDGVDDGDEIDAGTDPFFPDQPETLPASPELANEISKFLTGAIEIEIAAYQEGDPTIAAQIFAGPVLDDITAYINDLNSQGLVQVAELDFYNSYINDIRIVTNDLIEVDTCETWTTTIYRESDSSLVESDGPTLLPQTITIERVGEEEWFITDVVFHDAPAFCE